MELVFLGTASGAPSTKRNVSSIALRLASRGSTWLFDCGEGTQHQVLRTTLKPGKVEKIFITHMHGDHTFGLPGLLCSIANSRGPDGSAEPLHIYGPSLLGQFVQTAIDASYTQLGMPVVVHELVPFPEESAGDQIDKERAADDVTLNDQVATTSRTTQDGQGQGPRGSRVQVMELVADARPEGNMFEAWTLFDDGEFTVRAGPLKHTVPCIGYVIEENRVPGQFQIEKAKALGLTPGPLFKKLKDGETVISPSGVSISPEQVLGPSRPGRKLCILGDTYDSSGIAELARGCDVLVHESTFEQALLENAVRAGHSTAGMAGAFAKSIGAKQLVLTHFSARYDAQTPDDIGEEQCLGASTDDQGHRAEVGQTEGIKRLLQEAIEAYGQPNVIAAKDFYCHMVPRDTRV